MFDVTGMEALAGHARNKDINMDAGAWGGGRVAISVMSLDLFHTQQL